MDIQKVFDNFVKEEEAGNYKMEGVAIADREKVLLEHHFCTDRARNIYSHTKSYMSLAVGIAADQGKLSLSDKLSDYFPDKLPESPDEKLLKITLRDLLTMASGFDESYLMRNDRRKGVGAPDYVRYMLSRPMKQVPGEKFHYSTGDSILAGRMVEKAVGMRLGEFLYEYVFTKLGQGWPVWENDLQGHPVGGGGMRMKLTDMMKIGQLYLADGKWKGERIVSSNWIRQSSSLQISTHKHSEQDIWNCGYGYQFWRCPYPESYRADGAFGQVTVVLPGQELVVAVQCNEEGDFSKTVQFLHESLFLPLL